MWKIVALLGLMSAYVSGMDFPAGGRSADVLPTSRPGMYDLCVQHTGEYVDKLKLLPGIEPLKLRDETLLIPVTDADGVETTSLNISLSEGAWYGLINATRPHDGITCREVDLAFMVTVQVQASFTASYQAESSEPKCGFGVDASFAFLDVVVNVTETGRSLALKTLEVRLGGLNVTLSGDLGQLGRRREEVSSKLETTFKEAIERALKTLVSNVLAGGRIGFYPSDGVKKDGEL